MALRFNTHQKSVLFGILLGDAHLEYSPNRKTARLKIEQSKKHEAYIQYIYSIFKPWCSSEIYEYKGNLRFSTQFCSSFKFYADQFYIHEQNLGTNKKKGVPRLIHRWLNPVSLAHWYMDDGSINSKRSKAVLLNTHEFSFKEVNYLCSLLESELFQLQCWPRKQKAKRCNEFHYQIYISGHSYERLKELIVGYIIPEMIYEFPNEKKRLTLLPKK